MRSVPVSMRQVTAFDLDDVPRHVEAFALIIPLLETCLDDEPEALVTGIGRAGRIHGHASRRYPRRSLCRSRSGRGAGEERDAGDRTPDRTRDSAGDERRRDTSPNSLLQTQYRAGRSSGCSTARRNGHRDVHADGTGGSLCCAGQQRSCRSRCGPPLLCAIAWLQWARGKRAIAAGYLAEASRIEPEHILAFGLSSARLHQDRRRGLRAS